MANTKQPKPKSYKLELGPKKKMTKTIEPLLKMKKTIEPLKMTKTITKIKQKKK